MNEEAVAFNEGYINVLPPGAKQELLECGGLKKCPKCGKVVWRAFRVCPYCDVVMK